MKFHSQIATARERQTRCGQNCIHTKKLWTRMKGPTHRHQTPTLQASVSFDVWQREKHDGCGRWMWQRENMIDVGESGGFFLEGRPNFSADFFPWPSSSSGKKNSIGLELVGRKKVWSTRSRPFDFFFKNHPTTIPPPSHYPTICILCTHHPIHPMHIYSPNAPIHHPMHHHPMEARSW